MNILSKQIFLTKVHINNHWQYPLTCYNIQRILNIIDRETNSKRFIVLHVTMKIDIDVQRGNLNGSDFTKTLFNPWTCFDGKKEILSNPVLCLVLRARRKHLISLNLH